MEGGAGTWRGVVTSATANSATHTHMHTIRVQHKPNGWWSRCLTWCGDLSNRGWRGSNTCGRSWWRQSRAATNFLDGFLLLFTPTHHLRAWLVIFEVSYFEVPCFWVCIICGLLLCWNYFAVSFTANVSAQCMYGMLCLCVWLQNACVNLWITNTYLCVIHTYQTHCTNMYHISAHTCINIARWLYECI